MINQASFGSTLSPTLDWSPSTGTGRRETATPELKLTIRSPRLATKDRQRGTSAQSHGRPTAATPTREQRPTGWEPYERASDRTLAAHDREAAAADRVASAEDRAASWIDGLTGVYRREIGNYLLERETARAKRTTQAFTLAFVDVDGLKTTNDLLGHAAGDQRLHETASSIMAHLRSYDLIVRFGGDEFVCGLLDVTMVEAEKRFSLVKADLEEGRAGLSFTIGLAELQEGDTLEDLVSRADAALYETRNARRALP